jgi:hypothetical protein
MDNPIIVFLYCYKLKIRITDSISFDYADSPYHPITLPAPSYGLPVNTFSAPSKSPQKLISRCFLPENQ